jgi:enoyl-CoA hydratase/carnithine racemase
MSEHRSGPSGGRVLEVTLDRPKANAIDLATSRIMGEVFTEFRDDPDLRVAIITGGGREVLLPRLGPEGGGGWRRG